MPAQIETPAPTGIFALFKSRKSLPNATAAAAAEDLAFIRRNSSVPAISPPAPTTTTTTATSTDPYTAFINLVETDLVSMQKTRTHHQMRWKVPAAVDAKKACKGCLRLGGNGIAFDVERVGTLSYVVARW